MWNEILDNTYLSLLGLRYSTILQYTHNPYYSIQCALFLRVQNMIRNITILTVIAICKTVDANTYM